jgi:hypothetical protein
VQLLTGLVEKLQSQVSKHNEQIFDLKVEIRKMHDSLESQGQFMEGFKDQAKVHLEQMKVGKYLQDSELVINSSDRLFIRKFLESIYKQEVKMLLLFRASRDGWTPRDFHRLCNDQGATIIFMKTSKEKVCGGFTTIPWGDLGGYKPVVEGQDHCCLFSVDSQTLYPVKDLQNAVWHQKDYGPWFGMKGNLGINYAKQMNAPNNGFSNIGRSFDIPSDSKGNSVLTGED